MQLYAGTSKQFVDDTTQNRIAEKLRYSFFESYRYYPGIQEVNSWRNSLRAMANVVTYAELTDHGVILEYQLPLTSKRLDFMFTGLDPASKPNAVIVELKQWESVEDSDTEGCVSTFVAGRIREVLHPSTQVGQYHQYLLDCSPVFTAQDVKLSSCSYLHNAQYDEHDILFAPKHADRLGLHPLFTGDRVDNLSQYLTSRLSKGDGTTVLAKVLESKYRASRKLLDHVADMVAGQSQFVLLDDQLIVFNKVLALAKSGFRDKAKSVVLVQGGPGTGKSVIALHLIGELSKRGYNAQHATGSRAFTGNIQKLVGSRAANQFKRFSTLADAQENEVDILVCDEAHRIWAKSFDRFRPRPKTDERQIDQLVRAAKVSVFFIDDLQGVRPGEVGSSMLIRSAAEAIDAKLDEFELETQFRCSGSEAFVNWVESTLGVRRTANILWAQDEKFDFRIIDTVDELEAVIRSKNEEGFTARISAGFCWPWSDPTDDGQLVTDVQIGSWAMPWNARPDAGRLARGIPKSDYWASDPNGIDQVGCVYTAQGFEYDYAGVIFGKDLRYNPTTATWIGDRSQSYDRAVKASKDKFVDLVKQTYRVLLTRGMKGCYVYFMDEATRDFFRSRMEQPMPASDSGV